MTDPQLLNPLMLDEFLARLGQEEVEFADTLNLIEALYDYHPCAFRSGLGDDLLENPAGQNQGACKVFAFGLMNNLVDEAVLASFGEHYRAVLKNPDGGEHRNIRNFMKYGWSGIEFDDIPLRPKGH